MIPYRKRLHQFASQKSIFSFSEKNEELFEESSENNENQDPELMIKNEPKLADEVYSKISKKLFVSSSILRDTSTIFEQETDFGKKGEFDFNANEEFDFPTKEEFDFSKKEEENEEFLKKGHEDSVTSDSIYNEQLSSKESEDDIEIVSKNRTKKSVAQLSILNSHYKENMSWSRLLITEIALKTSLKPTQVYKWYWDQKLKEREKIKQNSQVSGGLGSGSRRSFNKKSYSDMLKNHEILICKEFYIGENLSKSQKIKDFLQKKNVNLFFLPKKE